MVGSRIILTTLLATTLCGCAALQMGWYKPGATQADFAQDKYSCMESSQERVSGAYVNPYGGAASSETATNIPLFQACMEARGYIWTNRAEVNSIEQRSAQESQQDDDADSGDTETPGDADQSTSEISDPAQPTSDIAASQPVPPTDSFGRQVKTIQNVFVAECVPKPPEASICGPLSALDAQANSLLQQVNAGTISEAVAEKRLKAAREEAAKTPDY